MYKRQDQTDEAEFQELRRRLNVLQQIIASTNEQLFIEAVTDVVRSTFSSLRQPGAQLDWRDLDLALHEMFLFGDLAMKAGGLYNKHKPNNPAAERLIEMMLVMVESGKCLSHIHRSHFSGFLLTITPRRSLVQPPGYTAAIHGNMRAV